MNVKSYFEAPLCKQSIYHITAYVVKLWRDLILQFPSATLPDTIGIKKIPYGTTYCGKEENNITVVTSQNTANAEKHTGTK